MPVAYNMEQNNSTTQKLPNLRIPKDWLWTVQKKVTHWTKCEMKHRLIMISTFVYRYPR